VTELVVASFSSGSLYINQLLVTNGVFNNDFSGVLTQVWNFADQTNPRSNNNLHPAIVANVPIVTYYDNTTDNTPKPDPTLIKLPPPSWTKYSQALSSTTMEVPPLPGQHPSVVDDTHHRIRDFMFLDAARNRVFGGGSPPGSAPPMGISFLGNTYHLERIVLAPVKAVEDSGQPQVSRGSGPQTTLGKLLAKSPVASNSIVNFQNDDVNIKLILYELRDQNEQPASLEPNWFGVAVPDGLNDYSKPIFYFHPTPGQNNYIDVPDYHAKKAAGPKSGSGRDWRELFAYVDRLGNQLAGAIKQGASPNQIVIVPFMTSRSASAAGIAFLKANWLTILTNILRDIAANP
jgi:hypothetical protein